MSKKRYQSKTCIAAVKLRNGKIRMGGDRKVSADWSFSYKCPKPKISKKANGMIVGGSGSSALCKLIVDVFNPPDVTTNNLDIYMFYKFLPDLEKFLKSMPGYKDHFKNFILDSDDYAQFLIAFYGQLFILDIFAVGGKLEGDDINISIGRLSLDDVPAPFAIGCGSASALPILVELSKGKGYNTKEDLDRAMELAAEISPGCDNEFDFLTED